MLATPCTRTGRTCDGSPPNPRLDATLGNHPWQVAVLCRSGLGRRLFLPQNVRIWSTLQDLSYEIFHTRVTLTDWGLLLPPICSPGRECPQRDPWDRCA